MFPVHFILPAKVTSTASRRAISIGQVRALCHALLLRFQRFQARVESTSSRCDWKASAADLGLQRVAAELHYSAIVRTPASRVLLQPFFLACGRVPPDRNALAPPADFGSQSIGVYSML